MDTPTLTTDTMARGPLSPSPPPLPSLMLTPRRTPGCCMVTATATPTTDTATLTTDTPTLDTTTASGQPTLSPSLRLLPTLTQTPRLTPTCFTVDTTDIPTLTGATTDILTSTANKSKS